MFLLDALDKRKLEKYAWEIICFMNEKSFLFKTFLDNNNNNSNNNNSISSNDRKTSNQSEEEEKCQKYDYPNKHKSILCYTT